MALVQLFEWLIVIALVYLGATQVVLPLWDDKPVFPLFRRPERLAAKLREAEEDVEEAKIEKEVERTKLQADRLRGKTGRHAN